MSFIVFVDTVSGSGGSVVTETAGLGSKVAVSDGTGSTASDGAWLAVAEMVTVTGAPPTAWGEAVDDR